MRSFGGGWDDDDQLFGIWRGRGAVEFEFTSPRPQKLDVELAFSTAPDFGDWQLSLNRDIVVLIHARRAAVEAAHQTLRGWVAHAGVNRLRITPAPGAARAGVRWGVDSVRITVGE